MRSTLRLWFIVLATAFAVLVTAPDLILPWHPWSSFGFSANGGQVVAVDAQAARSGLHPGDQIAISRLGAQERVRLQNVPVTYAPVGAVLRVPLTSGRTVALVGHIQGRTLAENVTDVMQVLGLLLYAILAATLVLLRPMPSTWAFYLFSYFFIIDASTTLFWTNAPLAAHFALDLIEDVTGGLAGVAFVVFAFRFPNVPLVGRARRIERVLTYAVAPILAGGVLAADVAYVFFGIVQPQWIQTLTQAIIFALFAAGACILMYRYACADDETRTRLQWVVAAFSMAYFPYLLLFTGALNFVFHLTFNPVIGNVASTISVIAPIALTYTVLRHRLFDIRLVVSRALIFGVLTTITVGILALADWGFGIWLAQSKFAIAAEAALALALGFSITSLHRRTERALNAIIFRAQTVALQTLRRFTHELDLIADPHRLLLQTYEALMEQMEIDYTAIYASEGSSFVRTCGGDPAPALLPGDDFAVLRLRRWSEPFECEGTRHPLRGALLLPMTVRTELVGFIACGPKRDGTHYLPEELETLSALAHRMGSAYAWLTVRPGITVAAIPSPS
jgi:hypothetical protein